MRFSPFKSSLKKAVFTAFTVIMIFSIVPFYNIARAADGDIYIKKKTTAQQLRDDKALRKAREQAFDRQGGIPVPTVNPGGTLQQQYSQQKVPNVNPDVIPNSPDCTPQNLAALNQANQMIAYLDNLKASSNPVWTPQAIQMAQYIYNPYVAANIQALYGLCMGNFINLKKAEAIQGVSKLVQQTGRTPGLSYMPSPGTAVYNGQK